MQKAKKTTSVLFSAAMASVSVCLSTTSVQAAGSFYTFVGVSGANWSDTAAWSPAGPGLVGDAAVVQVAGGNVAINLTAPATIGQLTLGTLSGAPFITDIGNGSTVNELIMDNTGGANNTDSSIPGTPPTVNANATIYSMGVAGSTNKISTKLALSGVNTSAATTTNIAAASTNSLDLSAGVIVDNNNASATTVGVTRTLQVNLLNSKTLTVGPITSRFSVLPVGGTGTVNLTSIFQIATRTDNNTAADAGTVDFTRASFGTVTLNGPITNGGSISNAGNVYNCLTQVVFGNGAANNGNAIPTIVVSGANTYSGGGRIARANLYLGTDSAFGTGGVQWIGGAASGAMGFNLFSTDDARTIANTTTWQRNLTVKGEHSLTFSGVWSQSNSSNLFNLLAAGKTVTFSNRINSDNGTGTGAGRLLSFDGSGTTVVSGVIANNAADDGLNGHVAKNGDGLLVLSGANTYRGVTVVNGGVLEFTNGAAVGNSASSVVYSGGAIGIDTGATVTFTHPTLTTIALADLLAAGAQPSTGAIALSTADAAANINYTTGTMANSQVVGVSIGALPGGVTYTGTITPDPTRGYRLGGGATLTVSNTNALSGANSVNIVNGGAVALSGNNSYTGDTSIRGTYIVSQEQAAAANIGTSAIHTNPTYVPQGVYKSSTLVVGSVADGASGIGNPTNATASNLTIGGGTLKIVGTGGTSSRLMTITPQGATIDSSGSAPVNFSNTGANVSSDASAAITATTASASNQLTNVTDVSDLKVGMAVAGTGIAANTVVTGIRPNYNETSATPGVQTYTVFISINASAAGTLVPLTFTNQDRALTLTGSNTGDNIIVGTLADSAGGKLGITKTGAGKWILNGTNTYNGETTVSAGTLQLGKSAHTPVLTGTNGATVDTALVLDYSGGGANPSAAVGTLLAATYANNSNFTVGQIASTAASGNRALGWKDDAANSRVLILNTLDGDATLDGKVNTLDFNMLAGGFGAASQVWANGNFNYDANVDSTDFNMLVGTYGMTVPLPGSTAAPSLGSVVPEPASMSLLVLGAAGLLRRRR